jgi:hypothetical protein
MSEPASIARVPVVLHVADVVQEHPGVAIELRDKLGQPQIPVGGIWRGGGAKKAVAELTRD